METISQGLKNFVLSFFTRDGFEKKVVWKNPERHNFIKEAAGYIGIPTDIQESLQKLSELIMPERAKKIFSIIESPKEVAKMSNQEAELLRKIQQAGISDNEFYVTTQQGIIDNWLTTYYREMLFSKKMSQMREKMIASNTSLSKQRKEIEEELPKTAPSLTYNPSQQEIDEVLTAFKINPPNTIAENSKQEPPPPPAGSFPDKKEIKAAFTKRWERYIAHLEYALENVENIKRNTYLGLKQGQQEVRLKKLEKENPNIRKDLKEFLEANGIKEGDENILIERMHKRRKLIVENREEIPRVVEMNREALHRIRVTEEFLSPKEKEVIGKQVSHL